MSNMAVEDRVDFPDDRIDLSDVLSYIDTVESFVVSGLKQVSSVSLVDATVVQDMLLDVMNSTVEFRKKVGLYVE